MRKLFAAVAAAVAVSFASCVCSSEQPATETAAPARPPRIAIYVSEENFAVYNGVFQKNLRDWLTQEGYAVETIGDKQAADAAALKSFDLLVAVCTFIVPDADADAMVQYVSDGGRLLWFDPPSRSKNEKFRALFSLTAAGGMFRVNDAEFKMVEPNHRICAGVTDFKAMAVGNPVFQVTGGQVVTWSGMTDKDQKTPDAKPRTFPAVVATRTGKGATVLFNCNPFAREIVPPVRRLMSNSLEWLTRGSNQP